MPSPPASKFASSASKPADGNNAGAAPWNPSESSADTMDSWAGQEATEWQWWTRWKEYGWSQEAAKRQGSEWQSWTPWKDDGWSQEAAKRGTRWRDNNWRREATKRQDTQEDTWRTRWQEDTQEEEGTLDPKPVWWQEDAQEEDTQREDTQHAILIWRDDGWRGQETGIEWRGGVIGCWCHSGERDQFGYVPLEWFPLTRNTPHGQVLTAWGPPPRSTPSCAAEEEDAGERSVTKPAT